MPASPLSFPITFVEPSLHYEMERAITFLVLAIEESGNNPKPVIMHSLNTGFYLLYQGYSKEVILAGILHDVVEDTATTFDEIDKEFGSVITSLVSANTYDSTIRDKTERYKDTINRCLNHGRDALIIKAADFLTNSPYRRLVTDPNFSHYLANKVSYFLSISSDALQGKEPVWEQLKERSKDFLNAHS